MRGTGARATMPVDEGQRKLTAILAADVAGYSRLMADDDRETVRTLTAYREVFAEHIETRQGRVVDTAGDSVPATFESVIEAVEAAIEIQRVLGVRNETLSGHRKMHFRMGVNLGDIIIRDDGSIYGDGVNVAARLEGLAEPGGIMIADVARQTVEGKLAVGLEDAGAHEVKNIAKPARAWRVMVDGSEPVTSPNTVSASNTLRRPKVIAGLAAALAILVGFTVWGVTLRVEVPQMVKADGTPTDDPVFAMPTGPTIAVLPFENLSEGNDDDYFANGLTEDLVVGLSQFPSFLVIARNSTLRYQGQSVDVREVSRDLGAQYVVGGSVRLTNNSLRVTVHLLDGADGTDLWANTYDRDLDANNLFEIQDEITAKISATIGDNSGIVTRASMANIRGKRPQSLGTYECWLRLVAYYDAVTPEGHRVV